MTSNQPLMFIPGSIIDNNDDNCLMNILGVLDLVSYQFTPFPEVQWNANP